MLPFPILVVLAFAAYRAARLVTTDSISETYRSRLYAWAWNDDGGRAPEAVLRAGAWRTYVYELVSCAFCLGVWAAAVVYGLWRTDWAPARGLVVVLAVAGGQAMLASRANA